VKRYAVFGCDISPGRTPSPTTPARCLKPIFDWILLSALVPGIGADQHCRDGLDEGDVLLVTRLDRLARSTRDLLNTLALIADKKAAFRSLGDTWADTTTAHGRLMLTVLAGLAEFERELIRARTSEGRERAKARGVKLGRKFKLTPHQRKEALARRERGKESLTDIARSYNVSHSTISRLRA
jgi:DNA invertase Pin-like site-specific DNA recombinase